MKNTTRRTFFIQAAAGVSGLAATQVMAQAAPMVDEKDPQAAALATLQTAPRSMPRNTPSTPPSKSAATASCMPARPQTRAVPAPCLLASKWQPKAGAAPTLKRLPKAGR